jgi:membrane associated rhomboid family serine protease
MQRQSWQSTVVALALIALVGTIFMAVFVVAGIDAALKAWAAIGTLVGVITGVVPAYFFKETADNERKERRLVQERLTAFMGAVPTDVYDRVRQANPNLFKSESV